ARRARQQEQLGEQRRILRPVPGVEQRLELVEPLVRAVAALETRRLLELSGEREQRAVLIMWRAEVTPPAMRLGNQPFPQGHGQSRLAAPRRARQQHHLAVA